MSAERKRLDDAEARLAALIVKHVPDRAAAMSIVDAVNEIKTALAICVVEGAVFDQLGIKPAGNDG